MSLIHSFYLTLFFGAVVCIRLWWPAKLPVAVWLRWSTHPRKRSYGQQYPPDYQVHYILFKSENYVLLLLPTQALVGTLDLFLHYTSVILLFRSCNRSLEVEDTDEASTSPSSSCPPPTSRNNSFRDRYRNQSVIIVLLLFFNHWQYLPQHSVQPQMSTLTDKMANVCLL